MGLACEKLGDFSRALEIYSAALSANPSSVELLTYKARSLMHLGRHGEARLVVSSIVNEPHHATWIVRGDLFAINGEYAAALSAYVQALPQSWSYQRLGEHALRRQDFSDALHYFTSAANSSTEFFSDAERGAAIAREHLRIKRY
jgi:tetratricopeptide (TPR) repeat protein